MKLSVIVPVYNTSKYLEQCLNSIVNQTYKNLEILLINDGSTDNSLEICQKFAESDSRIRIFDIPNGGVSNARNVGLDNATGDYIAFVDSDDYLDLTMYEKLMTATINENTDGAVCHFFYDIGGEISKPSPELTKIELPFCKKQFTEFMPTFGSVPGYIWRAIYKRTNVNQTRFTPKLYTSEDTIFLLYVLNSSKNFALVNEELYFYRIPITRGDHISSVPNIANTLLFSEKISEFYNKIGLQSVEQATAFKSYVYMFTQAINSKTKIKKLDADLRLKIEALNTKTNYKAYMKGCPSKSKKLRAFLARHNLYLALSILLKVYEKIKK